MGNAEVDRWLTIEEFLLRVKMTHGDDRRDDVKRVLETFLHHAPAVALKRLGPGDVDAYIKSQQWRDAAREEVEFSRTVCEQFVAFVRQR